VWLIVGLVMCALALASVVAVLGDPELSIEVVGLSGLAVVPGAAGIAVVALGLRKST
jgi:hypothetical protein